MEACVNFASTIPVIWSLSDLAIKMNIMILKTYMLIELNELSHYFLFIVSDDPLNLLMELFKKSIYSSIDEAFDAERATVRTNNW